MIREAINIENYLIWIKIDPFFDIILDIVSGLIFHSSSFFYFIYLKCLSVNEYSMLYMSSCVFIYTYIHVSIFVFFTPILRHPHECE